ncbi:hypothetical protein WA026_009425 [Henosepilachna vigintioctopunctata]|uniref:Cell death regulator Aven n=1 Tax=Henosepilachna vigintioctopunctata TaxID=420089 RepID=A0AAW1U5Y3_9CUCU
MDDPKKRGKQHLKNKTKYKHRPKDKAPVKISKSSTLMTNWDRYKDVLTSNSPCGADFSLLAEAPISKGSHFQFKSDAQDRFDVDNVLVDSTGIFNMDLNLLGLSVACIPFNERCDIPENYFLDTQIKSIKKNAADSEIIYQLALQKDTNINTKIKEKNEMSARKKHNMQDERKHVQNEKSSQFDPDYRDIVENNKNNKLIHPSIDKLNELEVKLDKLELISDSKVSRVDISNSHQYKGLSTPLVLKETLKDTSNMTDQEDSERQGGSSLLETESLQNWLDDILGD